MIEAPVAPKSRIARRIVTTLIGAIVITLVGWGIRSRAAQTAAGGAGKKPDGDRVVPVLTAAVEQRDVPIYLEGLGSVAAFATVTVKPQVEGRLDKVLFTEGQSVKKGDLLAQIDPRPFDIQLQQSSAATARDQAQLRAAQLNLERYIGLQKEGLAPNQQVDDQRAQVAQFEAVMRSDAATAASARLQIEYARITSPIDGVTGVRLVDAGNVVRPTDASGLVVITQLDPIAVLFTLPEDDLNRVQDQLAGGAIEVDAFSRDGDTKLAAGKLALIDNQINQATATIKLKAVFPNADKHLWPNQFVRAKLLLTTMKGALVVPAPAIQRGPKGSIVYVVGADQTVAAHEVVVDRIQGDTAIVKSGVAPGEQVVVDGQAQLKPGGKVSAQPFDKKGKGGDDASKKGGGGKGPRGGASASGAPMATGAPSAKASP